MNLIIDRFIEEESRKINGKKFLAKVLNMQVSERQAHCKGMLHG